ncbi:MAG: DUF86 domain-containing protein [Melioribacteraceae bacterium]|nr:DUF86 domain-containing protein [Melioribacteraceae bacterium]
MHKSNLLFEIMNQIINSTEIIQKRIKPIKKPNDFLVNDRSLERLDSLCMQLIALGESIKNLEKVAGKTFLKNYPDFEWKKAMGMRDIISHHYFDLNTEIVFQVCRDEIPKLNKILKKIIVDFEK